MNYIKAILFILSATIAFLFFSCEKGTEPEVIKPSRRDYVWTEDTLDIKLPNMLTYRYFVGNSPNDIWLGTLDASYDVSLWHYDGNKWETVFFPGYATSALWLFNDGTLWAGTKASIIWKRENGEWTESYKLEIEGYDDINIFDFYAEANNSIYAVGLAINFSKNDSQALIFHYNGTKWNPINIPNIKGAFHQIEYDINNKLYFIWGISDEEGNFNEWIYTFDGEKILKLAESESGFGLSEILNKVFINTNKKSYKYMDARLKLWKDFTGTDFLSSFEGRSESDFFNNSTKGLGHYNGLNYKTIYKTHYDLQGRIIFDKDIFIAAEDYSCSECRYIIIHGKLKD